MTRTLQTAARLAATLEGQLIVSCQAGPDEPLHGASHMAAMARAAQEGGAAGIRAESARDIAAIRAAVELPIIGLIKRQTPGYEVYITPTFEDARDVVQAGAHAIAIDATARPRPDDQSLASLIARIHHELEVPVLADVSTLAEALAAIAAGADWVAPTLSGYTAQTADKGDGPDWELLVAMLTSSQVPDFMEGRLGSPADARRAIALGAHAAVVGSALTRPQLMVRKYVEELRKEARHTSNMASQTLALGVDLGGTKILVGLIDGDGRVLRRYRYPTSALDGAPAVLDRLKTAVGDVLEQLSPEERAALVGLGVATAGMVDTQLGKVVGCTPNLPGWAGTELARELGTAHGLPTWVDNDANAAAYGEFWCGAAKEIPDFLLLTIGTGLGGGILAEGRLLRGAHGCGAEIGHSILVPDGLPCNCGQRGCLEAYVSGTALAQAARRSGHWGDHPPDSPEVFAMAREGNPQANTLIREMARYLAVAITSLINLYDPEVVLLGGGIADQADLFLPMVRQALVPLLGGRPWTPLRIQMALLGNEAGMVGAAGEALERFGAWSR